MATCQRDEFYVIFMNYLALQFWGCLTNEGGLSNVSELDRRKRLVTDMIDQPIFWGIVLGLECTEKSLFCTENLHRTSWVLR